MWYYCFEHDDDDDLVFSRLEEIKHTTKKIVALHKHTLFLPHPSSYRYGAGTQQIEEANLVEDVEFIIRMHNFPLNYCCVLSFCKNSTLTC
jgi:hypothetical protein